MKPEQRKPERIKASDVRKEYNDINLTVYINIADENNITAEQREALKLAREIYAEWIEECEPVLSIPE